MKGISVGTGEQKIVRATLLFPPQALGRIPCVLQFLAPGVFV